jgi:protein phosphatase PTC7
MGTIKLSVIALLTFATPLLLFFALQTHTGGEDAFFISQAGHGAVAVSDGVSAWAEDGIDPGEYSRTLVQYCCEAFEERVMAAARAANKGTFCAKFDPRAVLRYAQQCTCKPGSATVVLAAMQPGGKLHVANLGDCGVKVREVFC